MVFNEVYGLDGQKFTYRDFWAITLGSYACVQILSGVIVSLMCQRFGLEREKWKSVLSPMKCKLISGAIVFLYAFIIVVLAIVNGLMVFGGGSIYMYMGILLVIQTCFILFGAFVRMAYLAEYLVSASNWSIAGSIFFLIQIPSMFDYAPQNLTWLIAVASSVPMTIKSAFTHMRITQSGVFGWKERYRRASRTFHFWLTLWIVAGVGVLLCFFMAGTCITVYDPDVNGTWVPFGGTLRWSSRMMRSASSPLPCTGVDPCHVYLTVGSDLASEMFVTVHMPSGVTSSVVIAVVSVGNFTASEYPTPLLDSRDERQVFSALLSGLPSGSDVEFSIYADNGIVGKAGYFFKTGNGDSGDVNFVVSGDSGVTTAGFAIMNQMKETKPLFAVIGGDIVYDNGLISCACSWDQWLTSWEGQLVDDKYMIPISFAVGNHDVGLNDNNDGAFDAQNGTKCDPTSTIHAKPLYFAWFPFEVVPNTNTPLAVCERRSVHVHSLLNKLNVWILDSAYTESVEYNVDYVSAGMESGLAANKVNVAIYHVPLYSSNIDDAPLGEYLINGWVQPLFDAYNFTFCFEHHAHTYKRTKPLYNNTIATNGTVYLGDGKMGVTGMEVPEISGVISASPSNFFEMTGVQYHLFHVQIQSNGQVNVQAIDDTGAIFDTMNISNVQ